MFRVHIPQHDVNPRGPNSTAPVSQLTARGSSAPTRYGCPPRPGCRSALLRLRTNLGSCQSPSLAIAHPSAGKFRLRDGTTAGSCGLAPQTPKRGPLDPGFRMVGNAASPSAATRPRTDTCAAMFGRKLRVSAGGFPWWVAGEMHSTCSSAALPGTREPRRRNPAPPPTPGSGTSSVRCRPPLTSPAALQLMLTEGDNQSWAFHRNSAIVRRLDAVGRRTAGGVPYLDPTIQLLFEAKNPVPKTSPTSTP